MEEQIAKTLIETVNFAAIKHRKQRRKDEDATPYINHPIGVARILTHEANIYDIATLQAAILHDTVEDTDTTFDEIEQNFGSKVRSIVEEVTDDKSLPKQVRKQLQIEHAPGCSPRGKAREACRQTVQPARPPAMHACRLEPHQSAGIF
ncbi:hypothetical protein MTO96_007081 [Rhipicephalus appendiculatus]